MRKMMNAQFVRMLFNGFFIILLSFSTPSMVWPQREIPLADVLKITTNDVIKLDGHLTEAAWLQAESIGSLTMTEPHEGALPTEDTEVRILASLTDIYIGIFCSDRNHRRVSYSMYRDAKLDAEDHIKIVLDTFANCKTGYVFAVNAHGARYDALITNEGEEEDDKWDCIWDAEVRAQPEGWTAEVRIPIRSLRFKPGLAKWRFNIERRIQRLQETDRWASPARNFKVTHLSRSGYLDGLPTFKLGYGLTIRPYSLGNYWKSGRDISQKNRIQAGIDVLKRFGGNVTAMLTVNTDFAETDVDARQVNLTRFPLFFPEKRTFFLEGSEIFDFGFGLRIAGEWDLIPFFSRRIGLVATQIVPLNFALKTIGSIGDFNFGVLNVAAKKVDEIAPGTNLFVARGYRNLGRESRLGFVLTAGHPLSGSGSMLFGVDYTYRTTRFRGSKNFIVGFWGLFYDLKDVQGDRSAVGFKIDFPNDRWDGYLALKRIGDAFDVPLGFIPRNGIYKLDSSLKFNPRPREPWIRQMFHELSASTVTDLNGRILKWKAALSPLDWRFESGDRLAIDITPQGEDLFEPFDITPDTMIAPGRYRWTRFGLEVETADRRRIKTRFIFNFGNFYNGHLRQYLTEFNWRLSKNLNLSLEGEMDRGGVPLSEISIDLGRARINAFLSPDLQINSVVQYDSLTRSLGMNLRLRWTYRSLLDLFVIYNRDWLEIQKNMFSPQINQFIVKIQYAWIIR